MPHPAAESNRTWVGGWNYISQHDVFAETLLRGDPATAEAGPLLASGWEASNDFKTWAFSLREDIPFQFGWGEFTAHDVLHTFNLLDREDSLATMKDAAWSQATVEIVDDHNVKVHFENPYLDGTRLFSRHAGDLIIMSDAQFKAEGMDAFDNIHTAGTGPYQLKERQLGLSLLYEKVPDGHWAYDVDFEEFEFVWAAETLTRMAMLLAKEVHIAQIDRTLQPDVEARGMKVIQGTQEAAQTFFAFGGLYGEGQSYGTERGTTATREMRKSIQTFTTPGLPLENVNVRKALNKAIDRDIINEQIYLGRATPNYLEAFHPNNEGWNPAWVERWEEEYGYDPEEARRILEEEGFGPDNPLKIKAITTVIPGTPELHDVTEVVGVMWADIGVELELERLDIGAYVARIRNHELANHIVPNRNLPIRTTYEGIRNTYTNTGFIWGYPHPFLQEEFQCLITSADLDERELCARAIGDLLYDNFANIPMFHVRADVTVDPEFIADYVFTGLTSAGVSHFHEIKGVRE